MNRKKTEKKPIKKTREKIRVAFFSDVLKEHMDGVTHTIYNIVERVPHDRFEYLFFTPFPPTEPEKFPFPIVVCRYMRMPFYKEYPLALPFFDRKMERALDEFKPDLVHFTTPALLGNFAMNYAEKHDLPIFTTYHTHFPSYIIYYFKRIPGVAQFFTWVGMNLVRMAYRRPDLIFVPSTPIRDYLEKIGITPGRMMIWGRGINIKRYNPSWRDEKYMDALCGPGTFRVLFVSRLFWIKEIKTLVRIYRLLAKERPGIKMVITGDGPQQKYMEKRMPGAVFTGKLIQQDLQRIYASSDVFVFPSVTETFGNVVLEALASGLPVVAAAEGGPKGIVQDGVTGFHATPKNERDFVTKIVRLADDPALKKRMSKKGVAYAQTQKWDILCSQMFKSYEDILAARKKKVKTDA